MSAGLLKTNKGIGKRIYCNNYISACERRHQNLDFLLADLLSIETDRDRIYMYASSAFSSSSTDRSMLMKLSGKGYVERVRNTLAHTCLPSLYLVVWQEINASTLKRFHTEGTEVRGI